MSSTGKLFIGTLAATIRRRLQSERMRIDEEIGSYPAPIAGCDQQFNHLLAQRTALKGELTRLAALEGQSLSAEETIRSVAEFIQASAGLDPETKAALSAALREHAGTRNTF